MLRPAVQNKVLQREVDGGSNETRTEDETANLQFETRLAPWVTVHDNAAGVSSGFEKSSDAQGKSVRPCLAHDADDNASKAAKSEESAEEGIGTEIWPVSVERSENGAFRRYFETLAEISLGPIFGGGNNDNLGGEDEGSNETFLRVGTHYGRTARNGRNVINKSRREKRAEEEEGRETTKATPGSRLV